MPFNLPQGKISEWGWGEGQPVLTDEHCISIHWSRLSYWVLFVLLLSPKAHYSTWSYFTTDIFIFLVICVCVESSLVIVLLGIDESLWTGQHTQPFCLVRGSLWQKLFQRACKLFFWGIYYNWNAASMFINSAGVAMSPWHHSYKCRGSQLIFHFSAVCRSWQETLSNIYKWQ